MCSALLLLCWKWVALRIVAWRLRTHSSELPPVQIGNSRALIGVLIVLRIAPRVNQKQDEQTNTHCTLFSFFAGAPASPGVCLSRCVQHGLALLGSLLVTGKLRLPHSGGFAAGFAWDRVAVERERSFRTSLASKSLSTNYAGFLRSRGGYRIGREPLCFGSSLPSPTVPPILVTNYLLSFHSLCSP